MAFSKSARTANSQTDSRNSIHATLGAVTIASRGGYLDPKQVVNLEGEPDLEIITGDILSGVKDAIVVKAGEKVNLYTIDGIMVKRNVKATDALKGLKKGIYIVGNKKLSIQ